MPPPQVDIAKLVEKMRTKEAKRLKTAQQRILLLQHLKKNILKYEAHVLVALKKDLGKEAYESYLTELFPVYSEIKLFSKQLKSWLKPQKKKASLAQFGSHAFVLLEPLGIATIYAPWNYPFQLSLLPVIAAIAAGNKVILSISPKAKETADILSKILEESFGEEELVCLAPRSFRPENLLQAKVDYVFYTGGPQFGKIVATEAAKQLIPCTLELGGKSPCIVTSNAKLTLAAKRIAWAKLLNAGQTCVAPDYLFVQESVASQFMEELKQFIQNQVLKITHNVSNKYLPIIEVEKVKELTDWLAQEENVWGGEANLEQGQIAPAIIMNPDIDSPFLKEEIFAPILPILTYKDLQEVSDYICLQPKPLALYLFGNKKEQRDLLYNSSSGSVCFNDCIVQISHPHLPFGGVGNSGYGRYHGRSGLLTFSNAKSVLKSPTWFDLAIKYQLGNPVEKLKKILRYLG